ncbi:MAG TPA: RNA methyltransferase [Thermoleophilaceae bacterium]|jgi:TrmH family RNA methyltransferase
MITSPDNNQLKTIRKLQDKRHRDRERLFVAEGEDLVAAARDAGWEPEMLLVSGEDVEPKLLDAVSALGSGTRVIGVYPQRWAEPGGELAVYLHGVRDPGNVGTVMRSAHALADGPVVLGPGCADPWSPKAVRASMGSVFARPPARAEPEAARAVFAERGGATIALQARTGAPLDEVPSGSPELLCLGGERDGLPPAVVEAADAVAHLPVRGDGPDSLNVAMAATVALYERNRMARHG